ARYGANGDKARERIETRILVKRGGDSECTDGPERQRVAVRGGSCHVAHSQGAASAADPILDDHRLPEARTERLRQRPGDGVGRAARREWDHHGDPPVRIRISKDVDGGEGQRGNRREDEPPGGFHSTLLRRHPGVPGRIAGAGVPGLMLADGGLLDWRRQRNRSRRLWRRSRLTAARPLFFFLSSNREGPYLAQSRRDNRADGCTLSGVRRTFFQGARMSSIWWSKTNRGQCVQEY